MSSRSTLFYVGVLLILVAVGYQYRSEIDLFVRQYTSTTTTTSSARPSTPSRHRPQATDAAPGETTTSEIYNPPFDPDNPPPELYSESGTRLFTKNELAAHGPNGPLRPILLAIMGRVYNVDKGRDSYGPEGGYKFFAGIDGTRAYVTGEFNEEGLTDDLEGLSPIQVGEIDGWVKFYDEEYTFAGNLIGRYYSKEGSYTEEWFKTRDLLEQKDEMEAERRELQKKFPGCNSRWNKDDGGTIFCSEKSGGVHRDWVGFPRRYFAPGSKSWRCSCVHERDLDSPHLKLYPDCDPTSISCKTDPEALKKLKS